MMRLGSRAALAIVACACGSPEGAPGPSQGVATVGGVAGNGIASGGSAGAASLPPGAGGAGIAGAPTGSGGMLAGAGTVGVGGASTDSGFPGELVAFPGAEGFGKDALGGRGGDVCHVTTLADAGAGSLRDCVSQGNRTVVFDVGGWITLDGNLGITQSNLTIAGQTAPGSGIGIRGRKVSIGGGDIILRYVRIRRGIGVTTARDDAMSISSAAHDVIVDHCSVSFGTDETLSMPGDEGIGPRNLTLQWSIVAWGLQLNNHSAGALLTSNQTTIHHTLWAFNKTRNPRGRSELSSARQLGGHLDWVNNVIYGWNAPDPVGETQGWSISHDPFILAGTENGEHSTNAVGNYFISARAASYAFHKGTANFELYSQDNLLDGNANGVLDVSKADAAIIEGAPTLLGARLAGPEVTTQSPAEAFELVVQQVGATLPARDETDTLLISQVQGQTGTLIQTEQDLIALGVGDGGYGTLPEVTREPGFDSDRDGMPDAWERQNGLDPNDPADRNADLNGDGYTNLEGYLAALTL